MTKQKKRKNLWVAYKNAYVRWLITFPPPSDAANTERLILFAREFLAAAEREEVFRIVETRRPYVFRASDGITYPEYMQQTAAQTGKIPFFDLGGPYVGNVSEVPEYGQFQTPGRVCYFDVKGNIIDREVEDLGFLLKQLRPKDAKSAGPFMAPITPISITGTNVRVGTAQDGHWNHTYLFISLYTDIWFPWVYGILEDGILAEPGDRIYDNRELASCHTPRLNRFVASAREIALEFGGEWMYDELETPPFYKDMVHETGILLDVP